MENKQVTATSILCRLDKVLQFLQVMPSYSKYIFSVLNGPRTSFERGLDYLELQTIYILFV